MANKFRISTSALCVAITLIICAIVSNLSKGDVAGICAFLVALSALVLACGLWETFKNVSKSAFLSTFEVTYRSGLMATAFYIVMTALVVSADFVWWVQISYGLTAILHVVFCIQIALGHDFSKAE